MAMAIMYGVHFVRKFLLPFEWEKNKDLRKRSEKTISDSAAVQSMKKKKKKKNSCSGFALFETDSFC